jgi:hypothetical protein
MLTIAKVELIVPIYIARLCSGIIVIRITNPPAKTPEAPKLAMTLPTMSPFDVDTRPQTKLPISKNAR